jgi:hypothetical protein
MSLLQLVAYGRMDHYLYNIDFETPEKTPLFLNSLNNNVNDEKYESLSSLIETKSYEINFLIKNVKELQLNHDLLQPNDENCSICYCHYCKDEEIFILQCNHSFHKKCVKEWLLKKKTCPYCRQSVLQRKDSMYYTGDSMSYTEDSMSYTEEDSMSYTEA